MLKLSSDPSGDLIGETPATLAAPRITAQPVDELVNAGDFVSFSVVVAVTSGVTSVNCAQVLAGRPGSGSARTWRLTVTSSGTRSPRSMYSLALAPSSVWFVTL